MLLDELGMVDVLGMVKDLLVRVTGVVVVLSFFIGWAVLAASLFMSVRWVWLHLF